MCEKELGIPIATSKMVFEMSTKMFSPNSEMSSKITIELTLPAHVASDRNAIDSITKEIEHRACKKSNGPSEDFIYALGDCMVNYPEIIKDIIIRHDMSDEVIEAYSERLFAKRYPDNYKYLCRCDVPSWYELWYKYSFVEEYPEEFKSSYSTRPVESWVLLWKCHKKLDFMRMGGTISEKEAHNIFKHMYNHEYEYIRRNSEGGVKSWVNILRYRNTSRDDADIMIWFKSYLESRVF